MKPCCDFSKGPPKNWCVRCQGMFGNNGWASHWGDF